MITKEVYVYFVSMLLRSLCFKRTYLVQPKRRKNIFLGSFSYINPNNGQPMANTSCKFVMKLMYVAYGSFIKKHTIPLFVVRYLYNFFIPYISFVLRFFFVSYVCHIFYDVRSPVSPICKRAVERESNPTTEASSNDFTFVACVTNSGPCKYG